MTTVYIVTKESGSYSDYNMTIIDVTSSYEKAQTIIDTDRDDNIKYNHVHTMAHVHPDFLKWNKDNPRPVFSQKCPTLGAAPDTIQAWQSRSDKYRAEYAKWHAEIFMAWWNRSSGVLEELTKRLKNEVVVTEEMRKDYEKEVWYSIQPWEVA